MALALALELELELELELASLAALGHDWRHLQDEVA